MSKKTIIAFVGHIASGKDTAAQYLADKYNFRTASFTSILTDLLKRIYLPETRDTTVGMSVALREQFGNDILAKVMSQDITEWPEQNICISNARRLDDLKQIKKDHNIIIVHLEVDQKTRYERLIARNKKADDAEKSWEEFLQDEQQPTEKTIPELISLADEKINNNNPDHQPMFNQIDSIIEKHGIKN